MKENLLTRSDCESNRIATLISVSGMLLAGWGCGGPPDAGSVNISKAKEVAAQRGIPEAKTASAPAAKPTRNTRKPAPTEALPKGSR